jgi:hypothetical protein
LAGLSLSAGFVQRLKFLEKSLKNSFFIPHVVLTMAVYGLFLGTATAQTIVGYASPIADYQPFVDEKITSWKAANDKVGQIGGWRAYAKEAQQPDNTPAASLSTTPMPKVINTEPKAGQPK